MPTPAPVARRAGAFLAGLLVVSPPSQSPAGAGAAALMDIVANHVRTKAFEPPLDISNAVCWGGDWTMEMCCQGDATTKSECFMDSFSYAECCPNSDCWDDSGLSYSACCDVERFGPEGNPQCWRGAYSYEHCCLAKRPGQSWVDVLTAGWDTSEFYSMDEFYTDAQYGDDFGYYSTGRVLQGKEARLNSAQQFAHFTTYPMALSPHFGRAVCRLLLLMWIHLEERAPFRVVEMGAGSGQLAFDIQQCVRLNELGVEPRVWRRWASAFEYVIMERSPALAQRQRDRGLRVVPGDAQSVDSCGPVLAALAASDACAGGNVDAPECRVEPGGGTEASGASVVLSNELLDAFAPVKLVLSVYDEPNVADCSVWQEMRMVHVIKQRDLQNIARAMMFSEERVASMTDDLLDYTSELFCGIRNTTVGQAAAQCSPHSSCLAIAFGLSELLNHVDLHLPAAAHNMRLRLRKDPQVCERLREVARVLEDELTDALVLPRQVYQQLRHQLRDAPTVEVVFLDRVQTRQVPVHLSPERCRKMSWWMTTHEARIRRLLDIYRPLGYPAVQFLVRPGEWKFVELANCIIGSGGGFMLSVDYGASFEALGHSLTVDSRGDGIFIPPLPHELLLDLPDCFSSWAKCAGRVDWTTFVDFTNLAEAGKNLGWRTLAYGPQNILEHISWRNITTSMDTYSVPGYAILANSWTSRHVHNWYGRETLASPADSSGWDQRWTSFKALLMEKPRSPSAAIPVVLVSPSWHLDSKELNRCWSLDPATLPLTDWIRRHGSEDPREALALVTDDLNMQMAREYSDAYEEAQLSVRLVDWLVASEGCENFRPAMATAILESEGLWLSLRRRLLRAWEEIWGAEAVERVARAVLRRLSSDGDRPVEEEASPAECLGEQAYAALCSSPGGAVRSRRRLYAPE